MKHTGIVINSNVYKDNDLIVELLTENGIINFRSKGIKKIDSKNKSLVFDFAYIEAEFFKKGDKTTLINGKNLINVSIIYSSFEGLLFISFIKEILYKLIVDEEKHLFFNDLLSALKSIENSGNDLNILQHLIHLMLKLGELGGFSPLNYYEGTSFYNTIDSFYCLNENIHDLTKDQLLLLIKKLAFYLEETSDIQLNSTQLLLHL